MFEGIIDLRLIDIETGKTHDLPRVFNSITATGIKSAVDGFLFPGSGIPRIHVYDHSVDVTPAVSAIAGHAGTCDHVSGPSTSYDAIQQYTMVQVRGRLEPSSTAREIQTIGLARTGFENTPSFAVKLTAPVTQAPGQLLEVTYNLIARKSNNSTAAGDATQVSKTSDAVWDQWFVDMYTRETPDSLAELRFVDTPDTFSTGTSYATRGSLAENLGTTGANAWTADELNIDATATDVKYYDEASVESTFEFDTDDAPGYVFNKSLVSSQAGYQLYVNDIGYDNARPVFTAQAEAFHHADSTRPYVDINQPYAESSGKLTVDVAPTSTGTAFPVFLKVNIVEPGAVGVATYTLDLRHTHGFANNDYGWEHPYRLPAYSLRSSGGAWLKEVATGAAYTGTPISKISDDLLEAFSVRRSKTPGSHYIGENGQSDAICSPSPAELTFITNHGTTISKVNAQTPGFTATAMNNAAVIGVGGLTRTFVSCSATGLWRINEVLSGERYTPGIPFQVGVPLVDATKCYAVSARSTGETLFAVFAGGLARSLNGGTSWQVYGPTAGMLPFSYAGLTDAWSNVHAIIPGPTDTGSGISVIAIVLQNETVLWVELTQTGASVTASQSIGGVARGPFLTQKTSTFFGNDASTISSTQTWMFYTGTTVRRVPYTMGAGIGPIQTMPNTLTAPPVRLFEQTADGQLGMVMWNSNVQSVVLVDATFNQLATANTAPSNGINVYAMLMATSCKPFRHFYMTSRPQFAYFNAFANEDVDGGQVRHLMWRTYSWEGGEWVRTTATPTPRVTHLSEETLFSSSATGILSDVGTGISLQFEDGDVAPSFVEDESITYTITSGVQKDAYTTAVHRITHNFYNSEWVRGIALQALTDITNAPLNFCTTGVEEEMFSQSGVLSTITSADPLFTRSELTTLETGQSFAVSFRVTPETSAGTFAIGVCRMNSQVAGSETIDALLPVRIEFTNDTFQVWRNDQMASSSFDVDKGATYSISVDGTDNTFTILVDGAPIPLSTDDTIPSPMVLAPMAIGAYALNNELRYAYDMRVLSWPTTSSNGRGYYALSKDSTPVASDGLFITVESRLTNPATLSWYGTNNTVYLQDPRANVTNPNTMKLLPKSGMMLARSIPSLSSMRIDALVYKK